MSNLNILLFALAILFIHTLFVIAGPGANDVIIIEDKHGQQHSTPLQIYFRSEEMPKENDGGGEIHIHLNGQRRPILIIDFSNFSLVKQILYKPDGLNLANNSKNMTLKEGRTEGKIGLVQNGSRLAEIPFNVFFWKWTDKLVISDIDGTITRKDLMDILFPSLEWTRNGVKSLYGKIAEQGYKMVYLSARPLSLAKHTQSYLTKIGIPTGPIFLSPNSFLTNFEVMAEPTEYKANCLQSVKKLFPRNSRPFQAGLGNAETDKLAYEEVKIPYIFIVNSKGHVTVHNGLMRSEKRGENGGKGEIDNIVVLPLDYATIADNVRAYFPKLEKKL